LAKLRRSAERRISLPSRIAPQRRKPWPGAFESRLAEMQVKSLNAGRWQRVAEQVNKAGEGAL
jgi:hypothetical protein